MILITGAAGFIGINYIKYLLNKGINDFIVVDKFTYAANKTEFLKLGVRYEVIDISNLMNLGRIFDEYIANKVNTLTYDGYKQRHYIDGFNLDGLIQELKGE